MTTEAPRSYPETAEGSQEFILRAMSRNYVPGNTWDRLDLEACAKAANEIKTLREANKTFADSAISRVYGAPAQSEKVPVEVRRQDDAIDEIIIRGPGVLVHIEQMSADGWFMGVNAADGSYWQFWFGAKNRKSHVEFRHTEMISAEEETARRSPELTSTQSNCPACGKPFPCGCVSFASPARGDAT